MAQFVDVLVEATGNIEQVPAFWLEDPILGKGITLVESEPNPVPVAPVDAASEVEVTGPVETLPSLIPAVRDAIAAREAEAAKPKAKAKKATTSTDDTESSTKTPATGDKE